MHLDFSASLLLFFSLDCLQQKRGSVTDINVVLSAGPNEVRALSAVEGSLGRTGSACASVSDLAILSMRWVTSLREVIYIYAPDIHVLLLTNKPDSRTLSFLPLPITIGNINEALP